MALVIRSILNRTVADMGDSSIVRSASTATIGCGVHCIQDDCRVAVTKQKVLKKCGEPETREGGTWLYEKGGASVEIIFNNGRITRVRWFVPRSPPCLIMVKQITKIPAFPGRTGHWLVC